MKVLLVDVDGKMPNLALMKLSAYHKQRGDEVGFDIQEPDIVYASVILRKNRWKAEALRFLYPYAKIRIGGPGYNLTTKLPPQIEFLKPDYDLYDECDFSLGFTTRGCNRNCYFCIVPKKEGRFKRWQHPSEFYDERFDKIVFLDNNILLDKEWFFVVMRFCEEHSLKYWFTQGLDIRLVDEKVAATLREVKHFKMLEFAWDFIELEDIIREKINLLKDAGFDLRREIQFYVYVHSDADFDSALYRCKVLKELGTNAFVMFNIDERITQRIKDLRRWSYKKRIFWSCDFVDYNSSVRNRHRSISDFTSKRVRKGQIKLEVQAEAFCGNSASQKQSTTH